MCTERILRVMWTDKKSCSYRSGEIGAEPVFFRILQCFLWAFLSEKSPREYSLDSIVILSLVKISALGSKVKTDLATLFSQNVLFTREERKGVAKTIWFWRESGRLAWCFYTSTWKQSGKQEGFRSFSLNHIASPSSEIIVFKW